DPGGSSSVGLRSDGSYLITVQEGPRTLSANAPGYETQSGEYTLVGGQTIEVNFQLRPTQASVRGVVTDAVSGNPIANATVSGGGKTATTGASGQYELTGLPTGASSAEFTTSAPNYSPSIVVVTVRPGRTVMQDFRLTPSATSLRGRITNAGNGNPV